MPPFTRESVDRALAASPSVRVDEIMKKTIAACPQVGELVDPASIHVRMFRKEVLPDGRTRMTPITLCGAEPTENDISRFYAKAFEPKQRVSGLGFCSKCGARAT